MPQNNGRNPMLVRIVGSARSGTTLFRVMLAGHPSLFVPPEMSIGQYETMAERKKDLDIRYWEKGGLRRALIHLRGISVESAKQQVEAWTPLSVIEVYRLLQKEIAPKILVDKCPQLAMSMEKLVRTERAFESPRYLWIVRHPWAVIKSLLAQPMIRQMMSIDNSNPMALLRMAEELWRIRNENLLQFLGAISKKRWYRLHYEDLVNDPEPIIRRCLETIGVSFHPDCLDPYTGDRMASRDVKGAQPVGDPTFPKHGRIKKEFAQRYMDDLDPSQLGDATRRLAHRLGYTV